MSREQYMKKPSIMARVFAAILSLFLVMVFILFAWFSGKEIPVAALLFLSLACIPAFILYRAIFTSSRPLTESEAAKTERIVNLLRKLFG